MIMFKINANHELRYTLFYIYGANREFNLIGFIILIG